MIKYDLMTITYYTMRPTFAEKTTSPAHWSASHYFAKDSFFFKPIPPGSQSLQILHVNDNHWIAVSTVGCTTAEDIILYDSKYLSISVGTKLLLSQTSILIATDCKQSVSADCGVYAIAYITSIAFGLDPSLCVFNQTVM